MKKLSKNKKLNSVLNTIYKELLEISDTKEESINELKRYKEEFKGVLDYNIYQYGNARIYYDDIRELYKDYKSLEKASIEKLENIYKRQIRYITNYILKNESEI